MTLHDTLLGLVCPNIVSLARHSHLGQSQGLLSLCKHILVCLSHRHTYNPFVYLACADQCTSCVALICTQHDLVMLAQSGGAGQCTAYLSTMQLCGQDTTELAVDYSWS